MEENFILIIDNIFPKSAVGRNLRTLSSGISYEVLQSRLETDETYVLVKKNQPVEPSEHAARLDSEAASIA
jgi:hypothetical protein